MNLIQPYAFFGITETSPMKDLKKAYHRMALLCHPDKGGDAHSMSQITLAYQWIQSQFQSSEDHHKSFEEFYQQHVNIQKIPAFTDILADTYDYTRERFESLCHTKNIQNASVIDMLYIPAFEWALQQQATPETLQESLEAFLEMYFKDSSVSVAEVYMPMSDPRGYDTLIAQHASNENSYECHQKSYHTSLTTYEEPKDLTEWSQHGSMLSLASGSASGSTPTNFTVFTPTATYDYEEAFQTNAFETIAEPKESKETIDAFQQKLRERRDETNY